MTNLRRDYEIGEIYHVLNRGVERRDIFLKPQDYSRFILGLEFFNSSNPARIWDMVANTGSVSAGQRIEAQRKTKGPPLVESLAFCLMPNHFHLILREIKDDGITEFMSKMVGYSSYFNKQYKRVGPLFQGRYKAIRVKQESQLDVLFAYIHTNPVDLWQPGWREHGATNVDAILNKLKDYRWSSFGDYMDRHNCPQVTRREFFKDYFGIAQHCEAAVRKWLEYKGKELDFSVE